MDPTVDLANFSSTSFPDRTIQDPKKKTPAWIKQMAAAGVTEFMRSEADWRLWAHDRDITDNIRYAEGEQDTQKYVRTTTSGTGVLATSLEVTNRDGSFEEVVDDNGNIEQLYTPRHGAGGAGGFKDPTGLNSIVKAMPLPILPVKLRGLKSTVMQQGYEASITALGKKAQQESVEHEALARLWMDHGAEYRAQGLTPPPTLPDPMPETEAEMRTYLDNWQVAAAAELERKVKICWNEGGGSQQMSELADDILRHGYGCLADFQLPGQRPIPKRIMPHLGLFLPSAYPDYRDMEMGGYMETITLDQLLNEARNNRRTANGDNKEWTTDDRASLRRMAQATLPDNMQGNDPLLGATVGTGLLRVVRWYFRTDDLWVQESYRDESGYPRTKDATADQENPSMEGGKLTRQVINCLYEATLVCGTSLAYNCRKTYDQGRDLHNPLKARMPFSIFVAGLVQGKPVSVTRNAKGIIDEIERSYRAYMAIKRTYTPAGSNIPPDLLDIMATAMNMVGDDKAMQAYTFIKLQGDSFFPNKNPDNPAQPIINPITANPFGMPVEAAQHLKDVFDQLQLLEMVTGANAVVSAATPTGDAMGKGVNQIALQGAANVMSFLRDGLKLIYESHARNLAGRIWLTEKDVPVTGVVSDLDGTRRQVGPRPDLHEYEFFMEVNLGPTAEEKEQFKQNAFMATQGGPAAQLKFDDYTKVCWLLEGNLKTAQRFLSVAIARKARQDEARALNLQKANGDVQTQTGQAVEQARQQTLTLQNQLEMQRLAYARETAYGTVDRQTRAQIEVAQNNNATKIQTAHIAELGHAVRTDADHAHELQHTALQAALTPEPEPAAA